jgi:hypothetical protein
VRVTARVVKEVVGWVHGSGLYFAVQLPLGPPVDRWRSTVHPLPRMTKRVYDVEHSFYDHLDQM